MPAPKKNGSDLRDQRLVIRLSAAEKKIILQKAKRAHLDASSWARNQLLGEEEPGRG
ncbi:MAG TPA: hypothetical protein VNV25_17230 [Gemmatimonadaceae bacterium]|nr:hypothetical protein [Gemmatimonadaceae bacterium]